MTKKTEQLKDNVLAFEKPANSCPEFKEGETNDGMPPDSVWLVYSTLEGEPGVLHKVMAFPMLTEEEMAELNQVTEGDVVIRQVFLEDMINLEL